MATQIATGPTTYYQYGWESAYGTPPSQASINKEFGYDTKLSWTASNSTERLYNTGSGYAQKLPALQYSGTWNADFALSNPFWLRSVLGGAPTTTGSGPYTHTWTIANSGITQTTQSIATEVGFDLDANSVITLQGMKVNNMTVSASVGEVSRVRLEGTYKDETEGTSLDGSPATESEEPLTFAYASFTLGGVTIADVQSVEISHGNSQEPLGALGSRFITKLVDKQKVLQYKFNVPYEVASDYLEDFYGGGTGPVAIPAETSAVVLAWNNGASSTDNRQLTFTTSGHQILDISFPVSPNEIVKNDVTVIARTYTSVVAVNNTSSAP